LASHSRRTAAMPAGSPRARVVVPPLDELHAPADLDGPVGLRPDEDLRPDALPDSQVATEVAAHGHGRRAGRLVLGDPQVRREVAGAHDAPGLVDPCPDVDARLAHAGRYELIDRLRRRQAIPPERVDP